MKWFQCLIFTSDSASIIFVCHVRDLTATVTLHSKSSRLCKWLHGRSTLLLHADRALTQLPNGLCVYRRDTERGERKGDRREKREGAIRMKITRGEWAGNRNEGEVRWGSVKHEVQAFDGSKWKGGVIRKSCADKAEGDGRVWAKDRGRRGKDGRECWWRDEVWRDGDSLQWW